MAGIQHHGLNLVRVFDAVWPDDWLDDLAHIHGRDQLVCAVG
jgi:hypothetical protein